MDATLTQILQALFQAHQTIDALQTRVTELERALAEQAAKTEASKK